MWRVIGLFFAKVGHGALVAAQWSSSHPQVIAAINTAVYAVNPAAGMIVGSVEQGVAQLTPKLRLVQSTLPPTLPPPPTSPLTPPKP